MSFRKVLCVALATPMLFAADAKAWDGGWGYGDSCCCDQDWFSGWELYGDYLYWKPRRDDLDYAVNFVSATNVTGSVQDIKPKWDSGFRVGLAKECGDFLFDVTYTYLNTNHKDHVASAAGNLAGTHLVPAAGVVTNGAIRFAEGRWDLEYDTLDLLAGYEVANSCGFKAYVLGGFKAAWIDQQMKDLYVSTTAGSAVFVKQKNVMDAYGVDLGFGGSYDIWDCFKLFGRFSYDILVGEFDRGFKYETTTTGGATHTTAIDLKDNRSRAISAFNLALGLGYEYQFCGCWINNIGVAVGYEFHQYLNMPDFLEYQNDSAPPVAGGSGQVTLDRHLQSFGLDGLFVRVSVGF